MQKWVRAMYQPAIGLGENGQRVTGCKKHIALSRYAATEGMILLKNEDDVLPLALGEKVALFGKGCIDYVKGGGGSGDVTVAYTRNLYEGLKEYEKAGKIQVFDELALFYEKEMKRQYEQGAVPGMTVEPEVPQQLLSGAKAFTDTAIISICRYSGEDWDRKLEKIDAGDCLLSSKEFIEKSDAIFDKGDFYLTTQEEDMVRLVKQNFAKVIVVLNVGGMVDTAWFAQDDDIASVLLAMQAGMEGGLAMADILCGTVCPSGRLTDTYAKAITDYPSTADFHTSVNYAEYTEDIYVGYRYFETMEGAREKVNYPFGYGLSYTTFDISHVEITRALDGEDDKELTEAEVAADVIYVSADVTNTGNCAGKEVLQLYYGAPQGKLGKPAKQLGSFVKTRELMPGETQRVTMELLVAQMASYDDEGKVCKSAYVLEEGSYHIYLGDNVRDAVGVLTYDISGGAVVAEQLSEKCRPYKLQKRMLADGSYEIYDAEDYPEDTCVLKRQDVSEFEAVIPDVVAQPLAQRLWWEEYPERKLIEVAQGKMSLDEFMAQLSLEELIYLTNGHRGTGVTNTGSMGALDKYGVPTINTADGPAGLRIHEECCIPTTAFPCATLLASTWNLELIEQVGIAGAKEVKENNIGLWLTPAVNIHRSPLCGRNFEYYSEDPYLSGKMGAAMVRGMQSQHIGASVKHFACNNKETNRKESDSIVSERALREIYLKAFEIIVKESQPWTIMSSYNVVNGVKASENKELLTGILRDEWGFEGLVTSDWWNHSEQYLEIKAGNDIKMMNGYTDRVLEAYEKGAVTKEEIYTCAKRVLEMILKQD
ncbi:MAG: beta-glucosidase [Lachnospiraceae bacterium]|nr:beta-glucosidase [Lachnospiraceae bacterium]